MISVVVADDHAPFRAGVRVSLESSGLGFGVVGEAGDADGAVDLVVEREPDLVLLDVRMPGSGVVAARRISERAPSTAIVMLTASSDDDDLLAAVQAGASGYLLKDTDPDRLAFALAGVLKGEAAIPRELTAKLLDAFRHRGPRRRLTIADRPAVSLTSKEWEVLELLHDGLSTADIATRLSVAPVTVRSHVAALLHKLDVRDRAAAVALLSVAEPQTGGA